MRHLFREFRWVDYRYTPNQPQLRYRKLYTTGMDDFGNAIPYRPGIVV